VCGQKPNYHRWISHGGLVLNSKSDSQIQILTSSNFSLTL